MSNVKCFNIKHGINLYYIPETKFKTNHISINVHNFLKDETASLCALLSDVLGRGCKKFPDESSISEYMQELYGASFKSDVRRKGADQILTVSSSCVNDNFLPSGEAVFSSVLEFLFDIVLDPKVEKDAFDETYVSQEKLNLINDIDAMINDKRNYAVWRITELMFKDHPYSVYELGSVGKVKEITAESLYAFYRKLLNECPIDIFVVGNTDISKVLAYAEKRLKDINPSNSAYPLCEIYNDNLYEKETTEFFDVTQAKLCLGYKTSVKAESEDYYKLMVANGILGGGAHSKLFNEVREKHSLCYYVSSRLARYNGTMVISAGIESKNKDKTITEIKKQVELLKRGEFSDEEFDATIKSITGSIRTLGDSSGYLCDYYLSNAIIGSIISPEEYISKINNVTRADVIEVAQNLKLEMVYFLTGKESEEN